MELRDVILQGDALSVLRTLPDACVQTCVTSPPYWSLRDYGTARWVGGDPECAHREVVGAARTPWANEMPGPNGRAKNTAAGHWRPKAVVGECAACGAVREDHQLGLEATPEEWVARMVAIFAEVRRVLRPDGTLWLNVGDCYAAAGYSNHRGTGGARREQGGKQRHTRAEGLKRKDLVGLPWMLAFALRADGWWLRSDIIWHKPNPMPESCADRPTRSHEYIFLLSKSERYYYDADAVRTPLREKTLTTFGTFAKSKGGDALGKVKSDNWARSVGERRPRRKMPSGWETDGGTHGRYHHAGRGGSVAVVDRKQDGHCRRHVGMNGRYDEKEAQGSRQGRPAGQARAAAAPDGTGGYAGANLRDVWTVGTVPFREAHFACVDEETECLTINGWKRHDELAPGMAAAQFDMATQRLSWAPIEDVARYQVSGQQMVTAKSRDVELLLTPNHRTIVARRHPDTRQWQHPVIIRADELKPSHAVPVSASWEPVGDHPFSAEWAELLGWYIAEGCETRASWAVEIYQSRAANPVKVARIRALLDAVGAEYTEASATRQWQGRDAAMTAFQVRGFAATFLREWAPGKQLHPNVLTWSEPVLAGLMTGLVDGDGHRRENGRFAFIQRSKASADMVQAIGVRLGFATMLSRRSEGTYVVYCTQKRWISFRGTAGEGAEITMRPYSGIVWCPKLPAGTWVARRSGRAFITGNTFPPPLIEPCVLAGTSPKACEHCGAPWERVTEKATRFGSGSGKAGRTAAEVNASGKWAGKQYGTNLKLGPVVSVNTTGWRPTCHCEQNTGSGRCIVLDPFMGAGTTAVVARRHSRHYLGVELNADYIALAEERIAREIQPVLWSAAVPVDDGGAA